MPVGIQTIGDSLVTQIDSDYVNYVESTRGYNASPNPWTGLTNYVGAPDGSNLMFINPRRTGRTDFYSFGSSGGGFQDGDNWWIPTGVYAALAQGDFHTVTSGVDFVALCKTASAGKAAGTFGFQIFDATGQHIAFDATLPYLQLIGVYFLTTGTLTITLPTPPAGKKYYISVGALTMKRSDITDYGGSFDEQTYGYVLRKVSESQFTIHNEVEQQYNESGGSLDSTRLATTHTASFMVILA